MADKNVTDNSYMFVDEEKEDISKAGGLEKKGRFLDETVTGDIVEDSTINLVADEDVSKELSKTAFDNVTGEMSFQEKLEKRAQGLQENLQDIREREEKKSNVALSNDKLIAKGKGFGVMSLVLGIISLTLFCSIFNIITSGLSIVFGVVQLRRGTARGMAIAGIVTAFASIVVLIICMTLLMSNEAFVNMFMGTMMSMGLTTI